MTADGSTSTARRAARSARVLLFALGLCVTWHTAAQDSTPDPQPWNQLLEQCVYPLPDGGGTAVDYDCISARRATLDRYLSSLSGVSRGSYLEWAEPEQLAFLVNAYNAFTVALILTAYPELESIRDLGGFLSSPWKKRFIELLGDTVSLDDIEHGMIREPGRFDEPRIHFAVNCASIGCPALRREAYLGEELERQLEAQTRQFLGDRSRNRLRDGELQVSPLFDWYEEDFESGWRGTETVQEFLARYAAALGLDATQTTQLRRGALDIEFLDYDWRLNDFRPDPDR
jgi:hypothetical protein